MGGLLIQIADAIVTLLEPQVTAATGSIARDYAPDYELADVAQLKATVVARSEIRTPGGRKLWLRDYTVDVAIQQRVSDRNGGDALMLLVEQLANQIEDNPIAAPVDLLTAKVLSYDPEMVRTKGVFVSVITATYRGARKSA